MGVQKNAFRGGWARADGSFTARRAFTLVELLVVVGIISVLLAILMPTLSGARARAMEIQCAGNMRQVVQALYLYATWNRGAFPPNWETVPPSLGGAKFRYWFDNDRIGQFLKDMANLDAARSNAVSGGICGGVMMCPADEDGSVRSYSMNFWASSIVDAKWLTATKTVPLLGRLWSIKSGKASQQLLLLESWPRIGNGPLGVWTAYPFIGRAGFKPGQRFGAGTGISPLFNAGRFGLVPSELTYYRHRRTRERITQPVGRCNFGYVDGHVASRIETDLADATTGLSTLDSWWSPMDPELNTP